MSVARTARRRRQQYRHNALDQIYGAARAPVFKKKSAATLARKEREYREKLKAMQARGKK